MAAVETQSRQRTENGEILQVTEQYIENGSRTQTTGAATTTRTSTTPAHVKTTTQTASAATTTRTSTTPAHVKTTTQTASAATTTRTSTTPAHVKTTTQTTAAAVSMKTSAVHRGIAFEFTLSFRTLT